MLYSMICFALTDNRWLRPIQSDIGVWLGVALVFATHARYRFWPNRSYFRLHWADFRRHWKQGVGWGLVLGLGGWALTILSVFLAETLSGQAVEFAGNNPLTSVPLGWSWVPMIASMVVLAPVTEELFMRGMFYGWLRSRWGVWAGLLVSSVIFSLLHVSVMPYAFLEIFLVGLGAAVLYERTGSLAPAMMVHGMNNLIAVLGALALSLLGKA